MDEKQKKLEELQQKADGSVSEEELAKAAGGAGIGPFNVPPVHSGGIDVSGKDTE